MTNRRGEFIRHSSFPLSSFVPSLTGDTSRTLDEWREWADKFNAAGAIARRAGIWLAFHNEPNHMKPIDGRVPYDVFVERTDPSVVRHQLDVGNMALGGGDPLRYLEKYRDRYWSFHLKDVVADRSRDTELGTGTLDLPRIVAASRTSAPNRVTLSRKGPPTRSQARGATSRFCEA